jgi:hypothetical protein
MPVSNVAVPAYNIGGAVIALSGNVAAGPTAGTAKRDGKSALITTFARSAQGIYTFTLATKFPQITAGVACIEAADATPTDIVCSWRYDASTGILTIYCAAAAVLTDPEVGSRINFIGVVAVKSGNAEV